MSLLRILPRRPLASALFCTRAFSASQTICAPPPQKPAAAAEPEKVVIKSSCPEGTILEGVQWLKAKPTVQALADEAYPSWLWTIVEPRVIEDDGPGGERERVELRKANRHRIREHNLLKSH